MIKERILNWHEFCYLNGVRKSNRAAIETYSDYLFALRDLNIIAPNGQIEKKLIKLIEDQTKLGELLMSLVDRERKKDISLYLEDIS
jgi:hypothetical protein